MSKSLQSVIDELKCRVIAEEYVITPPSNELDHWFKFALAFLLDQEDYTIHYAHVIENGRTRVAKILASPGVKYQEIYENLGKLDK